MNHIYLAFIICCIALCSCTDTPIVASPPDLAYTNDGYKYFPSEDGYQWTYKTTIFGGNGDVMSEQEKIAVYDKSTLRLNFTINNQVTSYANWYNTRERLECCNGSMLIDYSELDCFQDSLLIREENTENVVYITTYQHCNTETIELKNYEDIECIKTYQRNQFVDGSELHIIRYFGYKIGLLKNIQTSIDIDGKIENIELSELLSHRF